MKWSGPLAYTASNGKQISQIDAGEWFGYDEFLNGSNHVSDIKVPENGQCVVIFIEGDVIERFKEKLTASQ